jgi:hypothetical protein
MAALPSLVQLQKKGNKTPATRRELENARKRALRIKTPQGAREAAKDAWELMQKRQIIQVFLDREAELINPKRPVPKPLFMDKKRVYWSKLDKSEKQAGINWLAGSKTEAELELMIKKAKIAKERKKTSDSIAKLAALNASLVLYKKNRKAWRDSANAMSHF